MQLKPKQTPLRSTQRAGCIFKGIDSLFNDNSRWTQRTETQKTLTDFNTKELRRIKLLSCTLLKLRLLFNPYKHNKKCIYPNKQAVIAV